MEWARVRGINLASSPATSSQDKTDLFSYAEYEEQLHKENERYERSAFDGAFSRIVEIGVLAFSDSMSPQGDMAWYGENKAELLRQFWERMGQLRPSLFITHNGLGFDFPFLKKRSIIQQVKPLFEINLAKFRTEPVYDTMAIWSNWDMRGWVKLDVLAKALNFETKSGSGSQVAEMWANDKKKDVAEYCLQDTFVIYGCYSRMVFQKPHSREDVLRMPQYFHVD